MEVLFQLSNTIFSWLKILTNAALIDIDWPLLGKNINERKRLIKRNMLTYSSEVILVISILKVNFQFESLVYSL